MKKFIYALVLVFTLGISTNTVSAANKKEIKTELTAEQKVQYEKFQKMKAGLIYPAFFI